MAVDYTAAQIRGLIYETLESDAKSQQGWLVNMMKEGYKPSIKIDDSGRRVIEVGELPTVHIEI